MKFGHFVQCQRLRHIEYMEHRVHVRPYRNYTRKRQAMIQTKDQRTDQISMRNTRNTLGTRNYTSANQSMNGNGNQFNFDYKCKNRNITHENSYQRGIMPIKYDNSGFQLVSKHKREDRTVDLADDFDIWLRKGSPSE